MKRIVTTVILLLVAATFTNAQQRSFDFQTAEPESFGISTVQLRVQADEMFRRSTQAYMIVYNDKVIYERYLPDWDRYKPHGTASAAKGIMGGLSLMLAIADGLIDLDDFAYKYVPQWQNDPVKSNITIRQLGAHTSGLDDSTEPGTNQNTLPGWKGDFWRRERNPFVISRDETPVLFAPGSDMKYSNPGIGMLNYVVTAAIKDTRHPDIRAYLWERVMSKMGIPQAEWSVGYSRTFDTDGLPCVATWGGGSVSTRAMAAIGRLLVNKGSWNGEQLIDAKAVEAVLKHSGTPSTVSGGFWLNADITGKKTWAALPEDTAMASGAQDQVMIFSPSRNLIIVRFGSANIEPGRYAENVINKYIGEPLMRALNDVVPYPKSEKITEIHWAPTDTIVRKAAGSDNFPITWARDDCLYTAYGDGNGFEPQLPQKLGLGFATILGMPDNFSGENVRSNGENSGSGANGQKASGLLAIGDSIYMWVRNADKGTQSRLARSKDGQKTWTWCDWRFPEFGHIAFINYGKNYQGARDEYVYMVSHDNPSAYEMADHFILMRTLQDKLTDRASYEFYRGLDSGGNPLWTTDVSQRKPVFTNPRKCGRSSISYNAGIGRYLWWQQISRTGGVDTRFQGGFAIFEAPAPWGPWKTVYYNEQWDTGPGELGCFPTKWMGEDGKTIHLVFSGNDSFSLRMATLTVADE